MKAISLWQPWATLMALGLKKNETRPWYTKYRGPLLIHAAKRKPKKDELQDICEVIEMFWDDTGVDCTVLENMPFGVLICKVVLVNCQSTQLHQADFDHMEDYLGDYSFGRYIWITQNVTAFDPILYRGSQGFFNVPDEIVNQKIHLTEKSK